MKAKLLLLVMVCSAVFFACTKSSTKPDAQAEKPDEQTALPLVGVNFNFSDFEVGFQGARKNAKEMAAKDFLTFLNYSVYDSAGYFVKQISHYKWYDSSRFGQFSDSLRPGRYDIVFVGSAYDSVYISNYLQLSTVLINRLAGNGARADVFYKRFSLIVSNKDTTLSNVRLDRITGGLEVRLKDTSLPSNVSRVTVVAKNAPTSFSILQQNAVGLDSAIAGQFSTQYDSYPISMASFYFGAQNKVQVIIRAFDKNNLIITEKIVENVYVYLNKKTVLSGKLFSGPANVEVPVTVDPDYAETINQSF